MSISNCEPTCNLCCRAPSEPGSRYCAPCKPKAKAAYEIKRSSEWEKFCPFEMKKTVPEKLPNQAGYATVMKHTFADRQGLLLTGISGRGKSRSAWLLLRREFMTGRSVGVLSSNAGLEYAGLFVDGSAAAVDWVKGKINSDLLFLDDVFKSKLTDSFEGVLFTIVNQRTEQGLPMVVTCNDTGASLVERMTPDRGEPMLRRLCEFCNVVKFL